MLARFKDGESRGRKNKLSLDDHVFQQATFANEATMRESSVTKPSSDKRRTNRRATVRFRCVPPNLTRAFFANSSKSVEAVVADLSLGGVGLIMDTCVEPGTVVMIEMGTGGKVLYVDLVAEVMQTTQLENGSWRCGCAWVHEVTEEELQILR
jgi:hypothetical protein